MFNNHLFDKHLLKACLAAVFAIGLTACSSSDSGTQTSQPTPGPTPTTPGPTPSDQVSDLFAKASMYETQASDAQKAAEDALMDATMKADMLDAIDVKGESATAAANAQAVLDAVGKVEMAAMNADRALTALKQAMMDADALPEGTANLDQLKIEIGNAIEAAEANLEAAEGVRDDLGAGSLAALEAMIVDNGEKTAAMWGMDVAASIQTGLTAYAIGTDHASAPGTASNTIKNPVSMNDAPVNAMTWEDIVGMDNVMTKPLGELTKVASLMGMTPAAVGITVPEAGVAYSATAQADDDATTNPDNYMGIQGSVYCLATTCMVDDDGKLGAGWYFSPTDDTQRYMHKVGTGYVPFDDYASYGYWLMVDGNGAVEDFRTFATSGADATETAAISTAEIGGDDGTATYSGAAAGMSVVTVPNPDGDGRVAGKSGAFTADVTLNATFGETPTIDGMITNFKGDAVGSGWLVTLRSQTLTNTANTGATRTDGQAVDGGWTALPYGGDADARPSGIHGGFNANFRDGMAVGAYATLKD